VSTISWLLIAYLIACRTSNSFASQLCWLRIQVSVRPGWCAVSSWTPAACRGCSSGQETSEIDAT